MAKIKYTATLILFLCSGCGVDATPEPDNYGYGFHYDAISQSGLRLRYSGGVPTEKSTLKTPSEMLSYFDAIFIEVENCTGITRTPPLIIIVKPYTLGETSNGGTIAGQSLPGNNTIVLEDRLDNTFAFTEFMFRYVTSHEFVHDLLDGIGFPLDKNFSHDHPFFKTCVPSA